MLSHLNTALNNTSTNAQHVESLYSGQIQCICTRLKGRRQYANECKVIAKEENVGSKELNKDQISTVTR